MKRTIALCLTLAIYVSLAIDGTMAYLQDTDSDVNAMTLENVKIELREEQRDGQGALKSLHRNSRCICRH